MLITTLIQSLNPLSWVLWMSLIIDVSTSIPHLFYYVNESVYTVILFGSDWLKRLETSSRFDEWIATSPPHSFWTNNRYFICEEHFRDIPLKNVFSLNKKQQLEPHPIPLVSCDPTHRLAQTQMNSSGLQCQVGGMLVGVSKFPVYFTH